MLYCTLRVQNIIWSVHLYVNIYIIFNIMEFNSV
jgi:hypothetical protein